jgi:hypothetical protein
MDNCAYSKHNGVKIRKAMITKSVINIKKMEKYNVIDQENHFSKQNYPASTNPSITIPIEKRLAIETDLL